MIGRIGDVSRPPYPHFEDAPEAELEEERAAFADWRRDNPCERDGRDEPEMPRGADYAEREEARAVALRRMFGVVAIGEKTT